MIPQNIRHGYEVVYGFRPKFPLNTSKLGIDFNSLHVDYHSYMNQKFDQLKLIRDTACDNAKETGKAMTERTNKSSNPLTLDIGDFVYMLTDSIGPGKKVQPKYYGPFIVNEILSPTLVKLKDKNTGKLLKNPGHLDRLKIAFVYAPNPNNYFFQEPAVANETEHDVNDQQSNSEKKKQPITKNTENTSDADIQDVHLPTRSRSKRQIRKPVRYLSNSEYGHQTSVESSSTDSTYFKFKLILAQRTRNGNREYLVQYKGEPAQNALWTPFEQLNETTKQSVAKRPSPVID
jgi:hypothetical protein